MVENCIRKFHQKRLSLLNWRLRKGDDELDAFDLFAVKAGVVRDKKVHARARRARKLKCVRSAQRTIGSESGIYSGRLDVEG